MRVLIVKTSALGDVVHAFPVVEYLKRCQHVDHIGWVAESAATPLLRAHPMVDTVIEIHSSRIKEAFPNVSVVQEWWHQRRAVRADSWDLLFDLQGNIKSGLVTLSARAKTKVGYGRATAPEWPNFLTTSRHIDPPRGLSVREEYLEIVKKYFDDDQPFTPSRVELTLSPDQERALVSKISRWPVSSPVWVVAVGSAWPNKMCKISTLGNVLQQASERFNPYFVFVAGNGDELRDVEILASRFSHSSHVLYRPDLPLLQRLMGRAHAVLSMDSLVLHLAGTIGAKTFGFFGPSSAARFNAPGSGCFQGRCSKGSVFDRRCPSLRTCSIGGCLKNASGDEMFQALCQWYEGLVSR